jgi:Fe-S-cluster-containing dehydrogenase component
MSGANLTVLKFTEVEDAGKVKWLFFKDQCRHCNEPLCVEACPMNAIKRQANGIVRIKNDCCKPNQCATSGPKPCQAACPYGIPKREYTKNGSVVAKKMMKCDFCYNRFEHPDLMVAPFLSTDGTVKSNKPACQVTCPPGAILTGAADQMLNKARNRVTYLKANGYPDANVYPPQGVRVTRVVWVLTEAREKYGV